jgi:hypothetical protein
MTPRPGPPNAVEHGWNGFLTTLNSTSNRETGRSRVGRHLRCDWRRCCEGGDASVSINTFVEVGRRARRTTDCFESLACFKLLARLAGHSGPAGKPNRFRDMLRRMILHQARGARAAHGAAVLDGAAGSRLRGPGPYSRV